MQAAHVAACHAHDLARADRLLALPSAGLPSVSDTNILSVHDRSAVAFAEQTFVVTEASARDLCTRIQDADGRPYETGSRACPAGCVVTWFCEPDWFFEPTAVAVTTTAGHVCVAAAVAEQLASWPLAGLTDRRGGARDAGIVERAHTDVPGREDVAVARAARSAGITGPVIWDMAAELGDPAQRRRRRHVTYELVTGKPPP